MWIMNWYGGESIVFVSLLQIMQQMEATLINTIATMLQTGVIGTYSVIIVDPL